MPHAAELWGGHDDWVSRGNTAIVGPDSELVAGPLRERDGIISAELDLSRLRSQRRQFDPVGHYARPDVFRLHVDVTPRVPVTLTTLSGDPGDKRAAPGVRPAPPTRTASDPDR